MAAPPVSAAPPLPPGTVIDGRARADNVSRDRKKLLEEWGKDSTDPTVLATRRWNIDDAGTVYDAHKPHTVVADLVADRRAFVGVFVARRGSYGCYGTVYLPTLQQDVFIKDQVAVNRAMHGDEVVVELIPEAQPLGLRYPTPYQEPMETLIAEAVDSIETLIQTPLGDAAKREALLEGLKATAPLILNEAKTRFRYYTAMNREMAAFRAAIAVHEETAEFAGLGTTVNTWTITGKIVRLLRRPKRPKGLLCTLSTNDKLRRMGRSLRVVPLDSRFPKMNLSRRASKELKPSDVNMLASSVFHARLDLWGEHYHFGMCTILKDLYRADRRSVKASLSLFLKDTPIALRPDKLNPSATRAAPRKAHPLLKDAFTFTVDAAEAACLDDAISVATPWGDPTTMAPGTPAIRVGVHIADVWGAIASLPTGDRDKVVRAMEAQGCTRYHAVSGIEPWSLLPHGFMKSLSLLPGTFRNVVTVVLEFDSDGALLTPEPQVVQSTIRVDCRLSYQVADDILASTDPNPNIQVATSWVAAAEKKSTRWPTARVPEEAVRAFRILSVVTASLRRLRGAQGANVTLPPPTRAAVAMPKDTSSAAHRPVDDMVLHGDGMRVRLPLPAEHHQVEPTTNPFVSRSGASRSAAAATDGAAAGSQPPAIWWCIMPSSWVVEETMCIAKHAVAVHMLDKQPTKPWLLQVKTPPTAAAMSTLADWCAINGLPWDDITSSRMPQPGLSPGAAPPPGHVADPDTEAALLALGRHRFQHLLPMQAYVTFTGNDDAPGVNPQGVSLPPGLFDWLGVMKPHIVDEKDRPTDFAGALAQSRAKCLWPRVLGFVPKKFTHLDLGFVAVAPFTNPLRSFVDLQLHKQLHDYLWATPTATVLATGGRGKGRAGRSAPPPAAAEPDSRALTNMLAGQDRLRQAHRLLMANESEALAATALRDQPAWFDATVQEVSRGAVRLAVDALRLRVKFEVWSMLGSWLLEPVSDSGLPLVDAEAVEDGARSRTMTAVRVESSGPHNVFVWRAPPVPLDGDCEPLAVVPTVWEPAVKDAPLTINLQAGSSVRVLLCGLYPNSSTALFPRVVVQALMLPPLPVVPARHPNAATATDGDHEAEDEEDAGAESKADAEDEGEHGEGEESKPATSMALSRCLYLTHRLNPYVFVPNHLSAVMTQRWYRGELTAEAVEDVGEEPLLAPPGAGAGSSQPPRGSDVLPWATDGYSDVVRAPKFLTIEQYIKDRMPLVWGEAVTSAVADSERTAASIHVLQAALQWLGEDGAQVSSAPGGCSNPVHVSDVLDDPQPPIQLLPPFDRTASVASSFGSDGEGDTSDEEGGEAAAGAGGAEESEPEDAAPAKTPSAWGGAQESVARVVGPHPSLSAAAATPKVAPAELEDIAKRRAVVTLYSQGQPIMPPALVCVALPATTWVAHAQVLKTEVQDEPELLGWTTLTLQFSQTASRIPRRLVTSKWVRGYQLEIIPVLGGISRWLTVMKLMKDNSREWDSKLEYDKVHAGHDDVYGGGDSTVAPASTAPLVAELLIGVNVRAPPCPDVPSDDEDAGASKPGKSASGAAARRSKAAAGDRYADDMDAMGFSDMSVSDSDSDSDADSASDDGETQPYVDWYNPVTVGEGLNRFQRHAVLHALRNRATLIQGPPGTGKTRTGCRLAYLFALANRHVFDASTTRRQVLYTGPSHKSVNVVAAKLEEERRGWDAARGVHRRKVDGRETQWTGEFGDGPIKVLRVFNSQITDRDVAKLWLKAQEAQAAEGKAGEGSSSDAHHQDKQLKALLRGTAVKDDTMDVTGLSDDVVLHRVIRDPAICPEYASKILELDDKLHHARRSSAKSTFKKTKRLMDEQAKLVDDAEQLFLAEADIVLTTTNESYSRRMCRTVDFDCDIPVFRKHQVLLDEAAFCQEQEACLPLVAAEKAVLIGDHKQLRPVVTSQDAGVIQRLEISLFERIPARLMLKRQYRMHPAIASFPAKYMYGGALTNDKTVMGKRGARDKAPQLFRDAKDNPVKFIHVRGQERVSEGRRTEAVPQTDMRAEDAALVAGALKAEPMSRCNLEEALMVVRVLRLMVGSGATAAPPVVATRPSPAPARGKGKGKGKGKKGHNVGASRLPAPAAVLARQAKDGKLPTSGKVKYSEVAVLTPYRAQAHLLRLLLAREYDRKKLPKDLESALTVGSIHAGQGSERPFVILSLVVSCPFRAIETNVRLHGFQSSVHLLGHVADERLMNVALTRAQEGMVIVGNVRTVCIAPLWRSLVDDLHTRGCMSTVETEAGASDAVRGAWGKEWEEHLEWEKATESVLSGREAHHVARKQAGKPRR